MVELKGNTAFITGAASGIGYGMAEAFLDAGMKVVVTDVEKGALDKAAAALGEHGEVLALTLDVTDRDAFAKAADDAEAAFGPVHLVCNNAGVVVRGPLDRVSYDDWDWVLGVNLGGVINGVMTFVPRLIANGRGHILNTSSMAGLIAGPGNGIYNTAKYAVVGLSETLKGDLAPRGIGVSVLCPGSVITAITDADRNRPSSLAHVGAPMPAEQKALLEKSFEGGSTPREIGDYVVAALGRGDFYIIPHAEFRDRIKVRFEAILAAVNPEAPPEKRLAGDELRNKAFAMFWQD